MRTPYLPDAVVKDRRSSPVNTPGAPAGLYLS